MALNELLKVQENKNMLWAQLATDEHCNVNACTHKD